jgi:hypothetical protein
MNDSPADKSAHRKRSARLSLRLTPEEKSTLEQLSETTGKSIAELVSANAKIVTIKTLELQENDRSVNKQLNGIHGQLNQLSKWAWRHKDKISEDKVNYHLGLICQELRQIERSLDDH